MASPGSPLVVVLHVADWDTSAHCVGYRKAFPFVNLLTHPLICWILSHLNFHPEDDIFISLSHAQENKYKLTALLQSRYPKLGFHFIFCAQQPNRLENAIEQVSQTLSTKHANRRLVLLFCDTIYFSDVLAVLRNAPIASSACLYTEENGMNSVCFRLEEESQTISNCFKTGQGLCNVYAGACSFPSISLLLRYLRKVSGVKSCQPEPNPVLQLVCEMIKDAHKFQAYKLHDIVRVGTKEQLERALSLLKKRHYLMSKPTIVIDIDWVVQLLGTAIITWKDVEMVLGDVCIVFNEMKELHFNVKLSFSGGGGVLGSSGIEFADAQERHRASVEGRLYELNDGLLVALGWICKKVHPLAYML